MFIKNLLINYDNKKINPSNNFTVFIKKFFKFSIKNSISSSAIFQNYLKVFFFFNFI